VGVDGRSMRRCAVDGAGGVVIGGVVVVGGVIVVVSGAGPSIGAKKRTAARGVRETVADVGGRLGAGTRASAGSVSSPTNERS